MKLKTKYKQNISEKSKSDCSNRPAVDEIDRLIKYAVVYETRDRAAVFFYLEKTKKRLKKDRLKHCQLSGIGVSRNHKRTIKEPIKDRCHK